MNWRDHGGDVETVVSKDDLCTHATIYWVTNTIGTSIRTCQRPPRALRAVAIELAGRAPHDTELAERAVRGLLGLPPQLAPTETEIHE